MYCVTRDIPVRVDPSRTRSGAAWSLQLVGCCFGSATLPYLSANPSGPEAMQNLFQNETEKVDRPNKCTSLPKKVGR